MRLFWPFVTGLMLAIVEQTVGSLCLYLSGDTPIYLAMEVVFKQVYYMESYTIGIMTVINTYFIYRLDNFYRQSPDECHAFLKKQE